MKTILPSPHHHFHQRPSVASSSSSSSNPMAHNNTARTSTTRSSFVAGGGGVGVGLGSSSAASSSFGNSKFFLKKQNRAATQIQAMCRAFLVQARLYRQRVLEPRFRELQDCETRKAEELRRIQQQLEEERKELPGKVQQEMEDSAFWIANLKRDIEIFTKVVEELKEAKKEEKRKNKELEAEARQINDAVFKLDVSIMKLANEVKENQETAEKYEWAIQDGQMQMDELEEALLKVCYQQGVLKKYINRIIKKVEEKAKDPTVMSPPSSPKHKRKSLSKKEPSKKDLVVDNGSREPSPPAIKERRKSLSKNLSKADLVANELTLLDLIASEPKDRRKSISRSSFSVDPSKSLHEKRSKRKGAKQSNKLGDSGNASFKWETYNDSKTGGENENSNEALMEPDGDEVCFDWTTKSWGHQSGDLSGAVVTEGDGGGRKPRRHTSAPIQISTPARHHSKNHKAAKNALKALVHDLKEIKKQGLRAQ